MERIINHEGKLKLNETFCPFSEGDVVTFEMEDVQRIQKRFAVEGVVGSLHLNIAKVMPWDIHDRDLESGFVVSPYSIDQLTEKTILNYPVHMTMCFNETADISPSFKLTFPDAVRSTFYAFVCNWDTGGVLKDATQYEFEKGDLENPVGLYLPANLDVLLRFQMEVMDRFWHYPDVALGHD